LCQPRVIVKIIVEKQMECRLARETEVLGENLPQRHFCPSHNPTWQDSGLNPGRRCGKPATNRLSHGAAPPQRLRVDHKLAGGFAFEASVTYRFTFFFFFFFFFAGQLLDVIRRYTSRIQVMGSDLQILMQKENLRQTDRIPLRTPYLNAVSFHFTYRFTAWTLGTGSKNVFKDYFQRKHILCFASLIVY
jgi:hypothetical protein